MLAGDDIRRRGKDCGRACALGLLMLLGANSSLSAAGAPAGELQRLGQWMAHYYENPQPDALANWMRDVSASGGLEKASARMPVMVFVSEVAIRHPAKVADWCDQLATLPAAHRAAFAWSFRNANAPQDEACLKGLPQDTAASLRDVKPSSPLNRQPARPGDLDMLWALFMASGDERAVNMIVDVLARPLPEKGAPGSVEALLMNGAAKWSLAANARQHPRVKTLLEQRRMLANGLLRQGLDEVLRGDR